MEAGKFRVERPLGKGGMETVVVARHLQLDQLVALKVLNDELASQPGIVERFVREARASARLRSEHACRVMDVGQLDSGAPYIVMELLEGDDLARIIAQRPLAIATAADYVVQACVAACHLKDRRRATQYFGMMVRAQSRDVVRQACLEVGVPL